MEIFHLALVGFRQNQVISHARYIQVIPYKLFVRLDQCYSFFVHFLLLLINLLVLFTLPIEHNLVQLFIMEKIVQHLFQPELENGTESHCRQMSVQIRPQNFK